MTAQKQATLNAEELMSLIADTNPDQDGTIGGFEGEIKML